jgi:hypothetical protein
VAVTCTGQGLALCAFLVLAGVLSCLAKDLPTSRILPMSALGALGMGVYYVGYYQSAQWPSPLLGLEKPVADLKYCATYTGGALTGLTWAPYVGAGFLALARAAVVSVWWGEGARATLGQLVSRYPLLVVSSIVMTAVTLARVTLGIEQAVSTRYVPFAVLFVAGILLLTIDELARRSPRVLTPVLCALLVMTLFFWPKAYQVSVNQARLRHDELARYRDCRLANPEGECDTPWQPFPYADQLRPREALLRAHHLSFFRNAAP